MESLKLAFNDQVFEIDLIPDHCPQTLSRLKAHLPCRCELHYAKIAGEEIMAIMPFHAPLESALEVSQAKAGMLAFWPRRHLLCLYYGKMQEEAASINLLGYLRDEPVEFAHAGEQVRSDQGKKLRYGTFYIGSRPQAVPVAKPLHTLLHQFEYDIWEKLPDEILELIERPGIMRPVGPLLHAEADTHLFHEYLATSIRVLPADNEALKQFNMIFAHHLCDFHEKMASWYLLPQTAGVIKSYIEQLSQAGGRQSFTTLLENLMLFVGRLNYWLDALIPWDEFNEHMKRNHIRV